MELKASIDRKLFGKRYIWCETINAFCLGKEFLHEIQIDYFFTHKDVMEVLKRYGFTFKDCRLSKNYIFQAITLSRKNTLRTMIREGIGLDDINAMGDGPLHALIEKERYKLVRQALHLKRCNVNLQNNKVQTPLMLAAQKNHIGIVRRLIEHGASKDILDNKGRSALDYASMHKNIMLNELL